MSGTTKKSAPEQEHAPTTVEAGLRRVATLVARESAPVEIFGAVTEEARRVLGTDAVGLLRFEPDAVATLLAQSDTPWEPPPLGTRLPLDGENVLVEVFRTGRSARVDDWTGSTGAVAGMATVLGVRSAVATAVVVEGRLWGTIIAATGQSDPLPAETESRLEQFTDLVATAIANAEARGELSRLAEEQAALRRIAVLVAQQPSTNEVFTAVTEAVGPLLGADLAAMHVFGDDAATVVASWTGAGPTLPIGTRLPVDGDSASARIFHTAAAARMDSYAEAEGETADVARELLLRSTVGAPILVEGKLWGALMAATRGEDPLPDDAETRIAAFTELVATAVSNAQAREDLQQLADGQLALRRVATLVARGIGPEDVFRAVAAEVGVLFGADVAAIVRFEDDGTVTVLGDVGGPHSSGKRVTLDQGYVVHQVRETSRSARFDTDDPSAPEMPSLVRARGIRSSVASPIVVEGKLWGAITAASALGPLPPVAERRLTEFTELVATAVANTQSREQVTTLADEQAALRRIATLVATGVDPEHVFAAVAEETAAIFHAITAVMRFEDDPPGNVIVGVSKETGIPIGTRWAFVEGMTSAEVYRTGRSARLGGVDWAMHPGPVAEAGLRFGVNSQVACPIVVEGDLWGVITLNAAEELPPDTEQRLEKFTELVTTAIANAEARVALRTAADEQGALRRVATLVAAAAPASDVFAAVTREVALVLDANASLLCRAEPNGDVVVVGTWADNAPAAAPGFRIPRGGTNLTTMVLETGRPARIGSYDEASGEAADVARSQGVRSAVGAPILVGGRVWGLVVVGTARDEPLRQDAEERLTAFTELVATAVANAEAHEALERVAAEQAALRRVATLVAAEASQDEVFNAVAAGVAGVLGEELRLVRYEGDDAVVVGASEGTHMGVLPLGTRLPVDGNNALSHVFRTGESIRIDDYSRATGPIAKAVRSSLRSIVATPVVVEGRTWGAMIVGTFGEEPVLPGTEARLDQFAALMATSIANAVARSEIERLAEQEAALRRIATLIARGVEPEQLFAAVAAETSAAYGTTSAVVRFEDDPPCLVVVAVSRDDDLPVGTRVQLADGMASTEIYRNARTARAGRSRLSEEARVTTLHHEIVTQVGAPVVVEGSVWGALMLFGREELPPGTEHRLERFAELISTAMANAATRAELVASRARIVAAGDEARRRIERNLHDGTQQRLIALGLDLQRARATVPDGQRETKSALAGMEQDLETILGDLRELSHGLHPPLLARLGLGPSLQALARRSPIPVHLEVRLEERPAASLEIALYYVVSEALTNAIKHSDASEISVTIWDGDRLRASIVDDGVGGAEPGGGSGLTGLLDRVDALGGRFALESPATGGTKISVELPLEPAVAP